MKLLSFLPMHKIMRVAKIPTNVWLEPKNEILYTSIIILYNYNFSCRQFYKRAKYIFYTFI